MSTTYNRIEVKTTTEKGNPESEGSITQDDKNIIEPSNLISVKDETISEDLDFTGRPEIASIEHDNDVDTETMTVLGQVVEEKKKLRITKNLKAENITLTGKITLPSRGFGGSVDVEGVAQKAICANNGLSPCPDYVFDKYYDGKISEEDKKSLGKDFEMLSISEMSEYTKNNRCLPTISLNRKNFDSDNIHLGTITNDLWQTVEVQSLYIKELKEEIEKIKSDINN